jgi:hypothetical protein
LWVAHGQALDHRTLAGRAAHALDAAFGFGQDQPLNASAIALAVLDLVRRRDRCAPASEASGDRQ